MAAPAWIRSGTVSVTNGLATITGTDTLWQLTGIGIKEGDIFTVNESDFYEIASVNSHTSITLRTPYLGDTASGQSYAIIRAFTYSTNADLAIRVAAVMEKWHDRFDEFATWSAGTVSGGPNADGTYPLTSPTGTVVFAKSPARLTADVGADTKNILINSHFQLWEEGGSFSFSNFTRYTANQWTVVTGGGGVTTISQNLHNNTLFSISGNQRYYLRWAQDTGASSVAPKFYQRVENVGHYAGETITISVTARGPLIQPISVYVVQNFGTGGSPSAEVTTLAGSITYTSGWADYHLTVAVPSINNKVLGTEKDFFEIRLQGPLSATFTMDLARIWDTPGTTPMVPRPRPVAEDILLSRRYYRQSYPYGNLPGAATAAGSKLILLGRTSGGVARLARSSVEWTTPMRGTPAMAYYDLGGNQNFVTADSTNNTDVTSGSPVSAVSTNGFQCNFNIPEFFVREYVRFQWTADARL